MMEFHKIDSRYKTVKTNTNTIDVLFVINISDESSFFTKNIDV